MYWKEGFGSNVVLHCFRQDSPWPLSLLAFRAASHSLALPRRAVSSADPLLDYLNQQVHAGSSKPAKTGNNVKSCYGESLSASEYNSKSHYDGNTMAPCCQSDDIAEGAFSISPVEQVSVSWGDADSELSAGIRMCFKSLLLSLM